MLGHTIVHNLKGEIQYHLYSNDAKNPLPEDLQILYLEDSIDMNKYEIIGINVDTNKPIVKEIPIELSSEDRLKQEVANLSYELMMKGGN